MKAIQLLFVFLVIVSCTAKNNFPPNPTAKPLFNMRFDSRELTQGQAEEVSDFLFSLRSSLGDLEFPDNIQQLEIFIKADQAFYNKPSQRLFAPYSLARTEKDPITENSKFLARVVTAHEFGHAVFFKNQPTFFPTFHQQINKLKEGRGKVAKLLESAGGDEKLKIRSRLKAFDEEIALNPLNRLAPAYEELFCDTLAVYHFKNLVAIKQALQEIGKSGDALRDYTADYSVNEKAEVHEVFNPARSFIGKKINFDDALYMKRLLLAISEEINKFAEVPGEDISNAVLNESLIERLQIYYR